MRKQFLLLLTALLTLGAASVKAETTETFTDFAIDFRTNPFTPAAPTGVTVEGTWHDKDHGYNYPKVTVPLIAGNYKITIGNCIHSNNNGTSVKSTDEQTTYNLINANGQQITSFLAKDNCYNGNENTTTSAWYVSEGETIKVICPQYTPYFKIEKVDAVPAAQTIYTVTYAAGGGDGIVPEDEEVVAGNAITLPTNRTLYKEGYTLTDWNDGTTLYKPGASYTPTGDVTLTAVFTANTKDLLNAANNVEVTWNFRQQDGAPAVTWEGNDENIYVTQVTIDTETIDVKMSINTNPGKFYTQSDWCGVNNGTTFTIPSKSGVTVETKNYNDPSANTLDGATPTVTPVSANNYTATFAASPSDGKSALVTNGNNYYRYVKATYPKSSTVDIDETQTDTNGIVTKVLRDGQLLIEHNGKTYNALGIEVK